MHLEISLPSNIEAGAQRTLKWSNEIVTTDGGYEVRNSRWSTPLRSWTLAFPNRAADDANFRKVEQLWLDTQGGTDTFNFHDDLAGETVKVRFDADLQITHTIGTFYHVDSFVLQEVRE
jgi:hypothetical protein